MASPGNQHCASCIGTLSFPIDIGLYTPYADSTFADVPFTQWLDSQRRVIPMSSGIGQSEMGGGLGHVPVLPVLLILYLVMGRMYLACKNLTYKL